MHLDRNRLVALIAACALIVGAAVYSAHGLGDREHGRSHCDLCMHLSSTAGSPAAAVAPGKPVLVRCASLPRTGIRLPTRSPLGNHLPRGPPRALQAAA